jgi:hypothetical protein
MLRVVISPFNVLNFPEGGGHLWVYMQYVLGLRQLGCDVYWLEQFRGSDDDHTDESMLRRFRARMEQFGMDRKLLLYRSDGYDTPQDSPRHYAGLSRAEAEAIFERTDLLLNFHYAIAPGLLSRFRRTALVDIDPGLLQFWMSRGQLRVPRHDLHFTTGETVGTPAALFPDCGLNWIRIRPPVSLERWPFSFDPRAEAFTTISNWDADDWIVDEHESYENTKRVAFLKFAELPRFTSQPLELALFLRTDKDASERRRLEELGWRVVPSREAAGTPEAYEKYIRGSRGEFSCVKPSCVRFRNAWISDRTLCYLASGKPAVVEDTGPSAFLPDGEGMFRFRTPGEAAQAIDRVNRDYAKHCRAARRIAEDFFDARLIAARILSEAMASSNVSAARPATRSVARPISVNPDL